MEVSQYGSKLGVAWGHWHSLGQDTGLDIDWLYHCTDYIQVIQIVVLFPPVFGDIDQCQGAEEATNHNVIKINVSDRLQH